MFRYMRLVDMLREVIEKGKQVKNVVYRNSKLNKTQIAASYSLVNSIVNNYGQFVESCELIEGRTKEKVTNRWLLMVMMGEYVNTGKIIGGGKLKRLIVENKDVVPQIDRQSKISKPIVQLRIRKTFEVPKNELEQLAKEGRKDQLVPNLYHFKYEVYSQLTKNSEVEILKSKACVMQSLSSCLPAYLLMHGVQQKWKNRKFDVMDACSAPGNKTIQLAEYLGNQGRVFAFEKDPKRFQLLQKTLQKYQANNVIPQNINYLEVGPSKLYKKVKFILLDPSCSGSGMLVNFRRQSKTEKDEHDKESFQEFCQGTYNALPQSEKDRVEKLHKFQVELLNHAVTLQPLRLSYSTCSIYKRQNEDVVQEFLKYHSQYRLKKFRITHDNISQGFGKNYQACIRIDPRIGQSDGFFVAVFTKGGVSSQK